MYWPSKRWPQRRRWISALRWKAASARSLPIAAIRAVSPPVKEDRVFAADFAKLAAVIASGNLAQVLR